MQSTTSTPQTDRLRVFGYGSLIWKPNFSYNKRTVGYIKGYLLRFFQGNTTQRGIPGRPGRVATVIPAPSPDARVWGCVYEVIGKEEVQAALDYLIEREVITGGYKFERVMFYPVSNQVASIDSRQNNKNWIHPDGARPNATTEEPYEVLFHTTDPEVDLYLGDATMVDQANQIASAYGSCGANSEYLLLIASFMKIEVPREELQNDADPYLFELEALVRQRLAQPPPPLPVKQSQSAMSLSRDTVTQSESDVMIERRRSSAREFAKTQLLVVQPGPIKKID